MTNSAHVLAALLGSWDLPPQTTPEQVRGLNSEDRLGFWRDQAKALELAQDVDHILAGMDGAGEDVSMFLDLVPSLYEAAIGYSVPWQSSASGSSRAIIDPGQLHLLRALGTIIDSYGSLTMGAPEQDSLRKALNEAEDLVLADQTLGIPGRRYIWQLIVEATNALDDIEQFGPGRVRSAAFELGGALSEQARVADDTDAPDSTEKASRLRSLSDKITGGFMTEVGRWGAREIGERAVDAAKAISS